MNNAKLATSIIVGITVRLLQTTRSQRRAPATALPDGRARSTREIMFEADVCAVNSCRNLSYARTGWLSTAVSTRSAVVGYGCTGCVEAAT